MKGDRDDKSAKMSATTYSAVVVNVSPSMPIYIIFNVSMTLLGQNTI